MSCESCPIALSHRIPDKPDPKRIFRARISRERHGQNYFRWIEADIMYALVSNMLNRLHGQPESYDKKYASLPSTRNHV